MKRDGNELLPVKLTRLHNIVCYNEYTLMQEHGAHKKNGAP